MTCALVMLALTAFCMWSMTKNRALLKMLREKEAKNRMLLRALRQKEEELQFTERLLYGGDKK